MDFCLEVIIVKNFIEKSLEIPGKKKKNPKLLKLFQIFVLIICILKPEVNRIHI